MPKSANGSIIWATTGSTARGLSRRRGLVVLAVPEGQAGMPEAARTLIWVRRSDKVVFRTFSNRCSGKWAAWTPHMQQRQARPQSHAHASAAKPPSADREQRIDLTLEDMAQGTSKRLRMSDRKETVDVRIPAGVQPGTKIRLSGKGNRLTGRTHRESLPESPP